jgi:hypothetical protein
MRRRQPSTFVSRFARLLRPGLRADASLTVAACPWRLAARKLGAWLLIGVFLGTVWLGAIHAHQEDAAADASSCEVCLALASLTHALSGPPPLTLVDARDTYQATSPRAGLLGMVEPVSRARGPPIPPSFKS